MNLATYVGLGEGLGRRLGSLQWIWPYKSAAASHWSIHTCLDKGLLWIYLIISVWKFSNFSPRRLLLILPFWISITPSSHSLKAGPLLLLEAFPWLIPRWVHRYLIHAQVLPPSMRWRALKMRALGPEFGMPVSLWMPLALYTHGISDQWDNLPPSHLLRPLIRWWHDCVPGHIG